MLTIKYPNESSLIKDWKNQLEELVVAHHFEEDSNLKNVILQDGETQISGTEAIQKFIKELTDEINDWRTPRCGV